MLLLVQNNTVGTYKGRNLDVLEIEGDIMETGDSREEKTEDLEEENISQSENNGKVAHINKIRKKKIVKTWSLEEKNAAGTFFGNQIRTKEE
ncbi:hypothetical protein JTB14_032333 [Gonioctena quinquepunctata]|nr:hypothetical protein JTB14_032333 [Gonioctena quinquepunctata]